MSLSLVAACVGRHPLCSQLNAPGSRARQALPDHLPARFVPPWVGDWRLVSSQAHCPPPPLPLPLPPPAAFYLWGALMIDNTGLEGFKKKITKDFVPTYAAELCIWPPFQLFNFTRIPVEHHLLAVNLMTVLDVSFLSWARSQVRGGGGERGFPFLSWATARNYPVSFRRFFLSPLPTSTPPFCNCILHMPLPPQSVCPCSALPSPACVPCRRTGWPPS